MRKIIVIGLLAAYAACCAATAVAAAPLRLKTGQKQLFLDDMVVEQLDGVQMTVHQVEKVGAVVTPDNPWEDSYIESRDAPLWNPEAQRWEMRYWSVTTSLEMYTCLAVSDDGLNWTKPNLGRYSFNGSTANNIVTDATGENFVFHVLYDSQDPDPQRRWKALLGERNKRPAVSPDGYNWTFISDETIVSGEESCFSYDEQRGLYIYSHRAKDANGYRSVNVSTSRDFVNWSTPAPIMSADAVDQQVAVAWLERHLADPTMRQPWVSNPSQWHAEIYNMAVFPYEGAYIGMPDMFRVTAKDAQTPSSDGFSSPGLAVSRDLYNWSRVGEDRPDFIPLSPVAEGNYDNAQLLPCASPIAHGDELLFYYTGLKERYGPGNAPYNPDSGALCLAKLRLDGFVSADAGSSGGTLLTAPLVWHGNNLWINANAAGGQVRVEVLDADGQSLGPQYSLSNAIPITSDGVRLPVEWQSGANMRNLIGEKIRLRFHLENAGLYSFWSEGAEPMLLENFEDGDFTDNPNWSIAGQPTNPGYWSVGESPTGSLALRHQIGALQQWHSANLAVEDIGTQDFELSVTINTSQGNGRQFIVIGGPNGDGCTSYGDQWIAAELNYTSKAWKMNVENSSGDASGYGAALPIAKMDMQGLDYRYTLGRKDGILYFDLDDLSTPEVEDWHREIAESVAADLSIATIQLPNKLGSDFLGEGGLTRYYDDIELTFLDEFPPGDANRDNKVDEVDAGILAENWLSGPNALWSMGDFNEDGVVDDLDAALMAANWRFGVESGSVPEPACSVMLFAAFVALSLRMNRIKKERKRAGSTP